jgi:hypothetical protein
VKIRGTAHHVAEKYLQLARDAQSSGDPVTAENHFQHAEHYLRMIAVAQEQFRAQNPYYQAPPAPGTITGDDTFEGEEDDSGQPAQGQPTQGQPVQGQPQNFGQPQQNFSGQPNFNNNPQNFNSQQPSYPPREQPQPYSGGQQPNFQPRPQQQNPPQQQQPYNQQPQPSGSGNDAGQLPSFITGSQPQPIPQGSGQNGGSYDNQGGGDRFPRHRRRRHRGPAGPGGPRPDMPQDFRGDDGSDAPGNS